MKTRRPLKKIIYIATCSEHSASSSRPTVNGSGELAELKKLIPRRPGEIIMCGKEKKYHQLTAAFGFASQFNQSEFIPVSDGSLKETKKETRVLLWGTSVKISYLKLKNGNPSAMLLAITRSPKRTVICVDVCALTVIGRSDAKPASVYKVTVKQATDRNLSFDDLTFELLQLKPG